MQTSETDVDAKTPKEMTGKPRPPAAPAPLDGTPELSLKLFLLQTNPAQFFHPTAMLITNFTVTFSEQSTFTFLSLFSLIGCLDLIFQQCINVSVIGQGEISNQDSCIQIPGLFFAAV